MSSAYIRIIGIGGIDVRLVFLFKLPELNGQHRFDLTKSEQVRYTRC